MASNMAVRSTSLKAFRASMEMTTTGSGEAWEVAGVGPGGEGGAAWGGEEGGRLVNGPNHKYNLYEV